MPSRNEFKALATLRLQEAEALFTAGFFDGCVYLCGYVVELALKARICAHLGIEEYPGRERLRSAFMTHNLEDLLLLSGLFPVMIPSLGKTFRNWSALVELDWTPEIRYVPQGTFDRAAAESLLQAIRSEPDGLLTWLSQGW